MFGEVGGVLLQVGEVRFEGREFSLDTQVQGLHNPAYDADLRLLVRGSWRFRR